MGGGFLGGGGPTLGDVPMVMRPPSQRQQKVAATAEKDNPAMGKEKEVAQGQGAKAGRSEDVGMWRVPALAEGPGRGANRGARDNGWQTREQKQAFLTNYFPGPSGRTTPWGDREEGEEGVPPLPMTGNAQTLEHGR